MFEQNNLKVKKKIDYIIWNIFLNCLFYRLYNLKLIFAFLDFSCNNLLSRKKLVKCLIET